MNQKPVNRSTNRLFSIILLVSLLVSSIGRNSVFSVKAEDESGSPVNTTYSNNIITASQGLFTHGRSTALMSKGEMPSLYGADCSPSGYGYNQDSTFFSDVLTQMGIPVTQFGLDAFALWEPHENTTACYNPLATTYRVEWFPSGTGCTETLFNSVGVRNYSSKYCGELATSRTLLYSGNGTSYLAIRNMLAQSSFDWQAIVDSLNLWCSGCYSTILANQWQTLWNGSSTIPSGFNPILSDIGVTLYKKDYAGGQPDYVQQVSLIQGASVKLLHGEIVDNRTGQGPYGGNDPTFNRTSLSTAWNSFSTSYNGAFCITNGQFFADVASPVRLAFSLKKDGQITSDGYGVLYEYPGQLLMLELWDNHADIKPLSKDSLYNSSAPNILGGLAENADKGIYTYTGRTFAGIDDTNNDGTYETVLIFNSSYSRQVDAAQVLRDFGADKIIMFDGGGSTQLHCRGTNYVVSSRTIPQTIGVVKGSDASCPTVSGLVRLYDGTNCNTPSVDVGLGLSQLESATYNFNDRAESISIPSGWSVRLYQNNNVNTNESTCLNSNDNNLNDNTYANGVTVSNNGVTWIRVYNNSTCYLKPGDANGDGFVDGRDYVIWAGNYAKTVTRGPADGDFDGNGLVDGRDYVIWMKNYNT